jgi:hypothetical protein
MKIDISRSVPARALLALALASAGALAFARNLPTACVLRTNARLVDPSQPFPPNSWYIDFVNNCGECVDITTVTMQNGQVAAINGTWHNVQPGEVRTGMMNVQTAGNWEEVVTGVQSCAP